MPNDTLSEVKRTAAAAGVGSATGAGIINAAGYTAIGMVGSGTGIGAAAGPVGAAVGAIAGITAYSVTRTAIAISNEPKVRSAAKRSRQKGERAVKRSRQKLGRWISGEDKVENPQSFDTNEGETA